MTGIVPMFVLMAVLYGSLNAALDTTAGERERGSLEPLLATPASRGALVVGKWGAAFALGLLIAVLSCMSFLPAQSMLRSESLAAMFRFGWVEAAWFIAVLAPFAAALSALMMAVAIRCRTVKEAQANNVVLTMAVSLTPMVGLFSQEGESAWNLWVPPIAQTTLMNRVLKNAPIARWTSPRHPRLHRRDRRASVLRDAAADEAGGAVGASNSTRALTNAQLAEVSLDTLTRRCLTAGAMLPLVGAPPCEKAGGRDCDRDIARRDSEGQAMDELL